MEVGVDGGEAAIDEQQREGDLQLIEPHAALLVGDQPAQDRDTENDQ